MAKSIARYLADMASPSGVVDGTLSTAAQTNITSVGTLSALTVDNLGINGNTITANSGALNLTPASGSAIVLDGTINVDAGVVTGATSITSTAFVGGLTGNVSGTAATVTGAAQSAITSVGTLSALTISGDLTVDTDTLKVDSTNNRVGIGVLTPEYPLEVNGSNVSSGGGLATFGIFDTGTAYNGTNPGGGVAFRGKYNNAGSLTNFATVQGIKENTTDGNYASALRFTTRANGGNLTEQMRINSDGSVQFVNTLKLHVSGRDQMQIGVDSNGMFVYNNTDSRYSMILDDGDGNVGIGTNNPVHDLHIHKAATGSQSRIQLTNGNTGATNADGYAIGMETDGRLYHWLYENAQMQFATNNTQRMSITAAGAIEIKGTSTTTNAQAFITNDNSVLSIGSSVSGSVVKDIQFNSPGAKMYIDGSTGYVGIGTTTPGSFLEIRKTTAGSITGGTSNQGATLTLHHEAQWENGYTGGDFVGALNFSSGDASTGEGVRAAIKVSVDSYFNSNKMRFYVAANNATTLLERMELDDELTFKGRSGTSPAIEIVNADTEDNDTGRESTLRFKGHRSGGELVTNAQISGHHFGTADDDKGGLIFWTNSGSAGLEEKMRMHEDGSITTPKRPCFVAHLAASTAYNSGVNQLNGSGWSAVHLNIGSHFSTSTGKFTAPVAGVYSFTVNLATGSSAAATTYWSAEIYVNTTRVLGGWNEHTAGYQRTEATYVRYLSAGDTVHAGMENATNVTLLGSNPGSYSRFEGYLIG